MTPIQCSGSTSQPSAGCAIDSGAADEDIERRPILVECREELSTSAGSETSPWRLWTLHPYPLNPLDDRVGRRVLL